MSRKLLLIFMLICMTKCKRYPYYSVENLYSILDRTSEYFKTLKNAHKSPNADTSNTDGEIARYMEATTKMIHQRQKRALLDSLQPNQEVNVLQGFEEALSVTNLSDFQDVAFVPVQDEQRLFWLAAAIDSSNIQLYQLFDNTRLLLASYPQPNGKRIIVNNYGADIFTVVQTNTGEIVVLRVGRNKTGVYEFQFKQEFEIPGAVYTNMWFGTNQLYLGVASNAKVFIYTWLGEHFDKIDTLHFGARKLLFFRQKSFVYIIVVGPLTRIFRFSVRSNKFIETQKLPGTQSAGLFYFKEGRLEERFLALADDNFTILYKEMYNRFVPFQRVASARHVHSLMTADTVILLTATEGNSVNFYQYDGWRFVGLHAKLSNIRAIRRIYSHDGDTLVLQNQDGEWKFLRPVWTVRKTWQALRNEIEAWCSEVKRKASQRSSGRIPDLESPVKIPDAHIGQLRVQNINDHNASELVRLTERYRRTISMLNLANNILTRGTSTGKSQRTVLYGKKVTVQCKTKCYVRRLNTDTEMRPVERSGKLKSSDQALKFANLKVKAMNNWKCPIPSFEIDDIFVKGTVNGILMETLQEGTLRISGNQTVSGEHFFSNLYATNISIPLDIATHKTSVILQIVEARAKELHLINDEFFLPLNGPTSTMTGSITAVKVKITGLIESKGKIAGKSAEKLMPIKDIYTPLELPRDCFLQNVTFRNLVRARDIVILNDNNNETIVRPKLSMKKILENKIPLNSSLPKHVILFAHKTQWDNVTIFNYSNWVTKNSTDTIVVSAAKHATNNIVLGGAAYENLSVPKLTIPICTQEVVTQDITSSLITVDDLIVENLYVSNVTGTRDFNSTMFGFVSALHNVDFSTKLFAGQVFVKNISASKIQGLDTEELKSHVNKWIDVDRIKGPVNISKLQVEDLVTPVKFNFPLPNIVNTVVILGNSNIGKINGMNMSSFIENAQKVNDTMSLEIATFDYEFASNHTHASYSTLKLPRIDAHPNLHSKQIVGTLETSAINVSFGYVANNASSTFVIEGTATFTKEPTVQNVKNVNLKRLSENLWMSDQNTVISGINLSLENMSMKDRVVIFNAENSLNTRMWLNLTRKLLSKTRQQNITTAGSFKSVRVPVVGATDNSILQTSAPELKILLTNSLMRNSAETQIVDATWHFEELNIDNLYWNGKFNDVDLNTEIVRNDAEQNIITGRKVVADLSIESLWSYNKNFSKFAKYALTEKCRDITAIRGRKTFKNINLNNLSVKGKLTGRSIEEALLKSKKQTVFGVKTIQGHLDASSFIALTSIVNDVNLMRLINDQVKKHELTQTIEAEINFRKDLQVFGNVTVGRLYEGVNMNNISNNSELNAVLNRTTEVAELTRDIKTGLHNPATYVSKFEEVNEDVSKITADPDTEDAMALNGTCICEPKNLSNFCDDTKLLSILASKNSSSFIITRLVLLDDTVFVIIVSSDFVSVYTYADVEDLRQRTELHLPDILQASVEPAEHALWIALRLPRQTLVLRYQAWNEFEQYVLPPSDTLVTSKTLNNQHLLIRSDGVWNLAGVFYPEHICKLPLNGEIKAFARGADYYVKVTRKNSTVFLRARYVGN
ncbi:PREDICTED: uncharacterized protein LOC106741904 [Dinoponera quadriceps]|uniref:Uncharacterized protein LOC106741904 n=1 Tax=Dinoponera quadriceps TaxID=609295 RepID=A0A6P3WUS1_DINQU|nr:PREDICTED: uncharacterized protein LOC106741904 [Dinoponera quadriceps]